MQKSSKYLIGAGILAVIVLAGALVGWLGSRVAPSHGQEVTPPEESTSRTGESPARPAPPPPAPPPEPIVPANPVATQPPAPPPATTITNWEDKLDLIVGDEDDDTNKVKRLLAIFRTLPPEGQEEAAIHLSNLASDEDYAPMGELLKDDRLPVDVLDTLMADLLNRPNSLKLPLLLDLARNANHPNAEESKDLLELYLEEDYGTDWDLWRQKMQEWLKENPD